MSGVAPIEARRLSVGYRDAVVVHEVDLTVRTGEAVALLGPNGSGKTTLVRGVLGLASVLGGDLALFGVPADRFRDRARIGYVPQRHTLASGLPATVREVVSTGRLARRRWPGRTTGHDREAVEHAIGTVGLTERADAAVGELSGGQQRRVLIARALAAEPDVLVMDEPTAGVDTASQTALAATLALLAERGTTLLVVTHEVGPLSGVVERAVVLKDGRVRHDGALPASSQADLDGGHHHDDARGEQPRSSVTGLGQPRLGR